MKAYGLPKKAKILQKKPDNLTSNDKISSIINSDDEDNFSSQPYTSRQSILITTNPFMHLSKLQIPVVMAKTIVQVGKNKKYPDVSFFYANRDNKKK